MEKSEFMFTIFIFGIIYCLIGVYAYFFVNYYQLATLIPIALGLTHIFCAVMYWIIGEKT